MDPRTEHGWPADPAEHVWTAWMQRTRAGTGKPVVQYRTCVHPTCGAVENREAPKA